MDAITQNMINQGVNAVAKNASDTAIQKAKGPQNIDAIEGAAKELEAVFLSEMLSHMFKGIETDPMFGGGQAEDVYKSMLNQEYGKLISQSGGIGLADSLTAEMIRIQEKTIQ